jgi:hypothetical protein
MKKQQRYMILLAIVIIVALFSFTIRERFVNISPKPVILQEAGGQCDCCGCGPMPCSQCNKKMRDKCCTGSSVQTSSMMSSMF